MGNIKIVFFDVDGTLLKFQTTQLSEKTVETLHRLQANGIKICVATGRPPVALPKFNEVDFDAFLTFNGSYCYTREGDVIFNNPISKEDVNIILRNAKRLGKPVSIAVKSRMTSNGTSEDLEQYYTFASQKLEISDDFYDLVENDEVYQLILACREAEYADILKDVTGAKITGWWEKAIDIIPADGGKGRGIEKILEYYGFDKTEAMAFGDGGNDIEMLQTVGTGVAMGNASDKVKAIADDICGDVADDGVYHYFVSHGLI